MVSAFFCVDSQRLDIAERGKEQAGRRIEGKKREKKGKSCPRAVGKV